MIVLFSLVILIVFLCLIIIYERFEPKIDVVKTLNKTLILLWYNKFNPVKNCYTRVYIKLFVINNKQMN